MKKFILGVTLALASTLVNAQIILSNNNAPGDDFTNATGTNQGQAVNSSGWYYNNTRNNGHVGINTNYARSGNGSAWFSLATGGGKADLEFLPGGINIAGNYYSSGTLGTLGDLEKLSYEYYVDSNSDVRPWFHTVIRVLVDADGDLNTITDRGGLVFEEIYNGVNPVSTDTWVARNITDSTNLWSFGAGMAFAQEGYNVTLSDWQGGTGTVSSSSAVIGISLGIGSGWTGAGGDALFEGAVDNVNWQFTGETMVMNNFEAVPEPATLSLLALAFLRRRKKNKS